MSATQFELKADKRNNIGKGFNRRLRVAGQIPAVLYGKGIEPQALAINPKDLWAAVSGEYGTNALLELDIHQEGSSVEKRVAMLRHYQVHPVRQTYIHVDFVALDLSKEITVRVPIVTTGRSKGVFNGGMVQVIRRTIGISCLAQNMPISISIDVTDLDIGNSLHVSDVVLPEGLTAVDEGVWTILTCVAPLEEKTPAEAATEVEGAVAAAAPAADAKKESGK